MNNTIVYQPKRDKFGKFKSISFKKLAKKTIFFQLVALSVLMNVWFVRHTYVVHCSAGGMFMTQVKCGELAQSKFDSQELARVQNQENIMANNEDLWK